MHTEMWAAPGDPRNVATLRRPRRRTCVGPASGALMGGDVGAGRVVEPEDARSPPLAAALRSGDAPAAAPATSPGRDASWSRPAGPANRSTRSATSATAPPGRWASPSPPRPPRRGAHGPPRRRATPTSPTPAGVDPPRRHDRARAARGGARPGRRRRRGGQGRRRRRLPARPTVAGSKLKKADGRARAIELTRNPDVLAELGSGAARADGSTARRCWSGSPPRPTTPRPTAATSSRARAPTCWWSTTCRGPTPGSRSTPTRRHPRRATVTDGGRRWPPRPRSPTASSTPWSRRLPGPDPAGDGR